MNRFTEAWQRTPIVPSKDASEDRRFSAKIRVRRGPHDENEPTVKSNLIKRGFLSLVATQFFGAMNDNVLKGILTFMVIDGAWAGQLGPHPCG